MDTSIAYNRAECQQTVYILKKKGKKHSHKNKSCFFFQETHLFSTPSPHTTFIKHSMASKRAGWLFLSNSTHGLFHSGLGYHVSGTSKSLAELSETLPDGKGQNKMNKERAAPGGAQNDQHRAGQLHSYKGKEARQVLSMESRVQQMKQHQTHQSRVNEGPPSRHGCLCLFYRRAHKDTYNTSWWHKHHILC